MRPKDKCKNCGAELPDNRKEEFFCDRCNDIFEAKYDEVKDYLQTHPNCFMVQVGMDFGLPIMYIKRWLQEKRFSLPEDCIDYLLCERCGNKLRQGKYCDRCEEDLKNPEVYEEFMEVMKKRDILTKFYQSRNYNAWVNVRNKIKDDDTNK